MKKLLALICIWTVTLLTVSAKTWEPGTHDCSLEFPDGKWILQEGGEINHGRMVLSAVNREQDKAVNVVRYEVARSITVQDSRFVQGLKDGFTKTGSRVMTDGYTNVNGCIVYWFTSEGVVNGQKIFTLRYTLYVNGRLYQVIAEHLGNSPRNDKELLTILNSFKILNQTPSPSTLVGNEYSLAYRIGFITGNVLILILIIGIAVRLFRKRSDTQKQ